MAVRFPFLPGLRKSHSQPLLLPPAPHDGWVPLNDTAASCISTAAPRIAIVHELAKGAFFPIFKSLTKTFSSVGP